MSRHKKSVAAALLLTTASATAAWLIKRRSDARRPHVGLYFEDGSMVSLPESSPQAGQLVELGIEAVALMRTV
ncbi:MAG: hypothetical protein H7287_04395 [Thermoleophilia bacterium]|nr:hypothetical protein [Thermoleophilia bacterium]